MRQDVATTILAQLGGRRFMLMTGARNLISADTALHMSLGRRKLIIRLNMHDTYDLYYYKISNSLELIPFDQRIDVHVEQLREAFTDLTGLQTEL